MSFRSFDLLNLVRDYGSDVIIRKTSSAGVYNPSTSSVEGSSTTDYDTLGYFFDFAIGLYRSDEVRRGTSRCVLPALGLSVIPDDEDKIIGLSNTYEIVSVQTFFSDGAAVCYICEVKD